MRRLIWLLTVFSLLGVGCGHLRESGPYTIGILEVSETPTGRDAMRGFIRALEDGGLSPGRDVRLVIQSGEGELPRIQKNARSLITRRVDMIVAMSTPSLQAALHASGDIPVIFSSVANPYLAGAGLSADDHLDNVAGVSSRGPIRQTLSFITQVVPEVRRIGTLWTPSELNSNFYLEQARRGAADLGLEIVAVPVNEASDVLLAAQVLVNRRIDVLYPISDNTINSAFEALGLVAEENRVPLFGSFLYAAQLGACAALGWDFYEMGYKTGRIALRVKNGESPGSLPFESMKKVQLYLNLEKADLQGVRFSENLIRRADRIIPAAADAPMAP